MKKLLTILSMTCLCLFADEFVESSTEKYDHKRGFCTLSADFEVDLKNLLETRPFLHSWEVSVPTPNGTLTLS